MRCRADPNAQACIRGRSRKGRLARVPCGERPIPYSARFANAEGPHRLYRWASTFCVPAAAMEGSEIVRTRHRWTGHHGVAEFLRWLVPVGGDVVPDRLGSDIGDAVAGYEQVQRAVEPVESAKLAAMSAHGAT